MQKTKNFEFEIPEENDFYNIELWKNNFEKLDKILQEVTNEQNN